MADETLKALVTEAMFKALDQGKRDELIKSALAALVTPSSRGGYKEGPSALEEAFAFAVRQTAQEIVTEMIKTEKAQKAIRSVVEEAFAKMLTDRDALATKMASALVEAITKRDY